MVEAPIRHDLGRHRPGHVYHRPPAGLLVTTGLGFAGAFGVPRWLLSYLKKRREKKFLEAFPDAVDIIVRGIKTGLPLLDCIKMITAEAPEPLKSEFRVINASHHAAGRGLRQTVRADAAAGGKFLRNCRRDPTEGRWQSFRGARKSFEGAA